ncbi:Hypothetical protein NTJ_11262 [Nesidiocoris tenuis]|uniref:Trichohyalin-plectin-homology domain-containing protein n=1 Tax=Nesidiocoris tenuis TaxID=355587 RepID=A0ABN7B5K8_9HEMI|nr:Hypothetical protein NTJ_11262 [Nesidiocoris tenuis]
MENANNFHDRIVRGASGEIGYIAKAPGHGKGTLKRLEKKKMIDLEDAEAEKFREQIKNDVTINRFWNNSDCRVIEAEIERRAELAMQAHDDDLELKRNRLRASMLNEESSLTAEYVNKAQQVAMKQFEHKKTLAGDIQSRQVDRQTAYVQKCYDRIFKENCDEFRTKTQQENRKALREAHIRQIKDRSLAEKLEKEEDQAWIVERGDEAWGRDKEMKSQRGNDWKEYTSALDAQVKDRLKRKRDEEFEERINELKRLQIQRTEEAQEQLRDQGVKSRRSRFNKEFFKHMEWNRDARERTRLDEMALDRIMIEDDRRKSAYAEAAVIDNREQLKRELLSFQMSLKQYKDLVRALESSEKTVVEEQRKFYECWNRQENRNAAKKRNELLESCLESRKKQNEDRKLQVEATKHKAALESAFLRFRIDQKEPLELSYILPQDDKAVKLRNSQVIAKVNIENERYIKQLQKMTAREEQKMVDDRKREDQDVQQRVQKLQAQSMVRSTDEHPFLRPLICSANNNTQSTGKTNL